MAFRTPFRTPPAALPAARRAPAERSSEIALPVLALCLGALAMGISPLFVRAVSGEIGPFASAFWRVALALPLLYGWMRIEEAGRPRGFGTDRATFLAGLAFSGDLFFWHLAILATTVANATFFATTAPVFVVLAAWLVLGRRPGSATIGGLALCLAGGGALIGQSLHAGNGRIVGDFYGIATAFFFGMYFLFVERARTRAGAGRVTFVTSLVTAAILLPVALVLEPAGIWPSTAGTWTALIALAWVSHAGGQGLLSVALGRLPAAFSSLVIFLEAVAAAGAAWLVLGERLAPVQIAGGAAIVAGIWIARPRRTELPR